MTEIRVAHTADLDRFVLDAARVLLDDVFGGEFTDDDWDHTLGGMHALAYEDGELVGHAAVVARRLMHEGRALRTGYLEGMAVRADRQRRGTGGALMAEMVRIVRAGYDLGALSATDAGVPLYRATGWQRWSGPTSVLTPGGTERTPDDDGGVWVLPVAVRLYPGRELTCDWRHGDVW
jgi:aminoglycoside 2'-N-acetyltransferase I